MDWKGILFCDEALEESFLAGDDNLIWLVRKSHAVDFTRLLDLDRVSYMSLCASEVHNINVALHLANYQDVWTDVD